MPFVTITANSQLPLGQSELHHLGIQPGDRIELNHLPDGELLLKPAKAKKNSMPFIGRHAGKVKKPITIEEMNETIAAGWAGELKPE